MSQRLVRILLSLLAAAMVLLVFGCGEDDIVDPLPVTTVTDIDGNVYETVIIGTQEWMKENLAVTHYRNGDSIPHVTVAATWSIVSSGAYCEYGNNTNNVATYGRMYNWHAVVDSRSIAPEGWHVPSDEEWQLLEMYLGLSQAQADSLGWRGTDEGGKLKAKGTTHWSSPNSGATNESGFSALPGGIRGHDHGVYAYLGEYACFWSSTSHTSLSALCRYLNHDRSEAYRPTFGKRGGFSIRCVKD